MRESQPTSNSDEERAIAEPFQSLPTRLAQVSAGAPSCTLRNDVRGSSPTGKVVRRGFMNSQQDRSLPKHFERL